MVRELNDLIHFTDSAVWRDEEHLAFLSNNATEVLRLYRVLKKHHCRSNAHAAQKCGISETSFKKYGRILREHLYYMVFFYNPEKARADARVANVMGGLVDASAMRLLFANGCRVASREAAERLLKKGKKYDVVEFVMEALAYLRDSVIRVEGSLTDYERYCAEFRQYKEWADVLYLAEEYHQRCKLSFLKRSGMSNRDPERTRAFLDDLTPHVGVIPSFKFHHYYFALRNHYYLETGDHRALINSCDEALDWLSSKPYPVGQSACVFHYMKVIACTYLGNYHEGERAAQQALDSVTEGTPNWFNTLEVYLYLALHTGQYAHAFALCQRALLHKRLAQMHDVQQETWRLLAAYCHIAARLTDTALPEGFPPIKSSKLPNEVPTLVQDKDGMNIAVLHAQIILQLLDGQRLQTYDRMEALEKYRQRHLKHDGFLGRSDFFTQVLQQFCKSDARAAQTLQKVQPLLRQIRTLPLQLTHQAHELEVLPYDALTHLLANALSQQEHRSPVARRAAIVAV